MDWPMRPPVDKQQVQIASCCNMQMQIGPVRGETLAHVSIDIVQEGARQQLQAKYD